MQETQVQSLGWEDPLDEEMANHSSILAWKIPWTEKPGRLQSMRSQELYTTEQLSTGACIERLYLKPTDGLHHCIHETNSRTIKDHNQRWHLIRTIRSYLSIHCCCCQSLSRVRLFATPWTAAHQASLSFTISRSLLKLMSIESVVPSNHLSSVIPFSSCLQSFNLFQHQEKHLIQWVGSSNQVAKVLELQRQHLSLQWIFKGWFPLGLTDLISLLSKGFSRVFSNTTVQKHQVFSIHYLC